MKKPECRIDFYGTKRWHLNGKLHREDGPAIEYADGNKYWYLNGKLHREDGPAVEWADGSKRWYLNSRCCCISWQSPLQFAKGFIRWIETVKELQGKK